MGDDSSGSKREGPDQPLLGLGVSLEAPWIEEAVIHTVPYIHTIFIIQIICYLLEDHSEEDAEESRCMYTTLVQAVGDRNELRQVTTESDLVALALVQLDHLLSSLLSQRHL